MSELKTQSSVDAANLDTVVYLVVPDFGDHLLNLFTKHIWQSYEPDLIVRICRGQILYNRAANSSDS